MGSPGKPRSSPAEGVRSFCRGRDGPQAAARGDAMTNPSRPVRVALYARVSTSNGQQDPEMQWRELREYASRREMQITQEYVDSGISGSRESPAALDKLMRDARRRTLAAVLVWTIDRLGPSLKHL